MAAKSRPPQGPDFRAAWERLDRDGKRRVRRAANRGIPCEDPAEAALAAAFAGNQRRFWRYGWVVGPVLIALLQLRVGWMEALVNGVIAGVLFAAMAYYFSRRAARAEAVNLEVANRAKGKRKGGGKKRKR